MLLRAGGIALAGVLDRRIRCRHGRELRLELQVPGGLPVGRVEGGKSDRDRIEGEQLGFVAIGTGTTLGSRGGDGGTGQRDEYSEEIAHDGTLCLASAGVNYWAVDDHPGGVNVPAGGAKD